MKILIADDEQLARERLVDLLMDWPNAEIVAQAKNGIEVIQQIAKTNADVLLLDIRMPGMDGLEAARHISQLENPPAIIFTTAYSDFALAAFESNAIDYLLKPIKQERLFKALSACGRLNKFQLAAIQQTDAVPQRAHLSIQTRGNIELIAIEDIYYFLADHKYITVRHQKGEALMEETLKHLEQEFSESFIRIHRNALVKKSQIVAIHKQDNGGSKLALKNCSEQLDVSQRLVPVIRKYLKELI